MIGPHWSKGWIIEDCEISNSKCAEFAWAKLDPDNEHYFTNKHVKSPDTDGAGCRLQRAVSWMAERKIGGHIIRR